MKVKTSITLSEELLDAVNERTRQQSKTRSDFIETAVWAFLRQIKRDEQNARDLEIINQHADALNREAADVLEYQRPKPSTTPSWSLWISPSKAESAVPGCTRRGPR
jgi:metal-responsive CopG/Arc/MetJ family transcriptional regulator